jgi:hypothetical protein
MGVVDGGHGRPAAGDMILPPAPCSATGSDRGGGLPGAGSSLDRGACPNIVGGVSNFSMLGTSASMPRLTSNGGPRPKTTGASPSRLPKLEGAPHTADHGWVTSPIDTGTTSHGASPGLIPPLGLGAGGEWGPSPTRKLPSLKASCEQSPYYGTSGSSPLLDHGVKLLESPYDEHQKLRKELRRMKATCDGRLQALEQEYEARLERQYAELTGSIDERLTLAARNAKEAAVDLLWRKVARRMLNAALASGWTAWLELWRARVRGLQLLRFARGRLHETSGVGPAFYFWARACDRERREAEVGELRTRVGVLEATLAKADSEKAKALERQLVDLTGPAEERMKLREAEMREAQVELLRRQILRRMMNADLSGAWGAWCELWEARSYSLRRLREVGNKLRAPELAESFGLWAEAAASLKVAAEREQMEREAATLEGQLRQARFELGQLRLMHTALQDESRTQGEKMAKLADELESSREALLAAEAAREENDHLKDMHAFSSEAQASAEQRCEDAEKAMARQLHENQGLLEELLAAQRQKFEEELAAFKQEHWARSEAEEKERRLNRMREQIVRRMMNQGVIRGWQSWVESWEARRFALTCQRRAQVHIERCSLRGAVREWWHHSQSLRQAKLNRAEAEMERYRGLEAELSEARSRLHAAESERTQLRERVAELSGDAEQAQQALVERQEKEREERIELLHRQSLRKLLAPGLSVGFGAWVELWEARTHALKQLRRACARLQAPILASAFRGWADDWTEARHAGTAAAAQRQVAELEKAKAALSEELRAVRDSLAAQLAKSEEEKQRALQRQAAELTGSLEERMAAKEAEAREARVEERRVQMARRMKNMGINSAWTAWVEAWEARTHALWKLRKVGNMLRAPELASAFGQWAENHEAEVQAAEKARLEREANSIEAELRRVRYEHGQMGLVKAANAEEIRYLREKVGDLSRQAKEHASALEATSGLRGELQRLEDLRNAAVEEAREAERRRKEAEEDTAAQREGNQKLLERLLAEQRAMFDDELRVAKAGSSEAAGALKAFEAEVQSARDEVLATKRELRERERGVQKARDEAASVQRLSDEKDRRIQILHDSTVQQQKELTEARTASTKLQSETAKLESEVTRLHAEIARLQQAAASPKPPKAEGGKQQKKSSILGKVDLDEGPDAPPISEQIFSALRASSARVLDLFREWDTDGDGEVSRTEFLNAMPKLGFNAPKKDVLELFDSWDKDGGGTLTLRELNKCLSEARVASNSPPPSKKGFGALKAVAKFTAAGAAAAAGSGGA